MGLLCAEQHIEHIKKMFRNVGTPVRRTKRRKFQKNGLRKVGDSCTQNKTSEISTHVLLGILGLLCAGQNVGNRKHCSFSNYGTPARRTTRQKSQKMHFQEFWDSCAQNKTSEISTRGIPSWAAIGILGDLSTYLVTWRLGKPFLVSHIVASATKWAHLCDMVFRADTV